MQSINIEIDRAQIKSFTVHWDELSAMPVVSATIMLISKAGKKIAEYSIASKHWQDELQFDLPSEMARPIMEIMGALESVVVRHMNEGQKVLKEKSHE